MPPKFLRKYQPRLDAFRSHPVLVRHARWLQHPNLWHFNRHSVPGAVAIGLFAGLVPGPFQMLTAALIAVPFRKNLPIALIITLYTNPFTIVPLYLLAYALGHTLLGINGRANQVEPFEMNWSDLGASWHGFTAWLMSLGKPLAVGLPVMALLFALIGYLVVELGWRIYIIRAWRRRKRA